MRPKAAAEPISPIIANVKVNGCSSKKKVSSLLFIFLFTFHHYLATNLKIKKTMCQGMEQEMALSFL